MRAMVLETPRPAAESPLLDRDANDALVADDEIALRIVACGVCRTDLQLCEGDLAMRTSPIVPGHQIVGVVEEVGPRARGFSVGERAGVAWLASTCGRCAMCASG